MADIEYTVGETAITVSFLGAQGPGVPAGGTAGQRLVKSSSDDYDTEWESDPAGEVESVNGETGVVVLSAADVGAAAASHSHTLSDITDAGTAAAADSGDFATAAQGGLADSAVQPGDLATVATSGDYADLTNKPTLGTAAATDSTAYATAAQGSTADSATQPGDDAATLGSGASTDGQVLTSDGAGGAAWETPASGVTDHGLLSGLTDDDHTQYALADGTRGSFASTAQGGLADTATQPGDDADTLGSGDATDGHVLTADGVGGAAWEAIPAAPVTSVNGDTGVVVLDNTDVGAAATSHTHSESDISDLGSYALDSHNHDSDYAAAGLLAPLTTNTQAGTTYTLVLSDAGKRVEFTSASPVTLTVPADSSVDFPAGTRIAIAQRGDGQVTVAGAGGVTINSIDTLKLAGKWAYAELFKDDTDEWDLFGRLEAA